MKNPLSFQSVLGFNNRGLRSKVNVKEHPPVVREGGLIEQQSSGYLYFLLVAQVIIYLLVFSMPP
jgi:hypothetical protein